MLGNAALVLAVVGRRITSKSWLAGLFVIFFVAEETIYSREHRPNTPPPSLIDYRTKRLH
jgi:hypothetical protein